MINNAYRWQLLAVFAGFLVLLYCVSPVLTPFVIAGLCAYLMDPFVNRLQYWGLPRTLAVTSVFLLLILIFLLIVAGLVPLLEEQINAFIEKLPHIIDWINHTVFPWVKEHTGISLSALIKPDQLLEVIKQYWQQTGGILKTVLASISMSGKAVLGFLGMISLVPVVAFYLSRDWHFVMAKLQEMLPRSIEPLAMQFFREANVVLGAFLRGQMVVMLALGMIYTIGLLMIGLDLAILIGLIAGLVSFVPYLGIIIGGTTAVIAAAVEFQDWFHPFLVIIVFSVGQMLEGFILTPLLVGDRVGLHPVAVIFAILVGGQLFGFLGVLLALPIAAVSMVAVRYAYQRYLHSRWYQHPVI